MSRQSNSNLIDAVRKAKAIGAFNRLLTLDQKNKRQKYSTVPESALTKSSYEDRTANGLTGCIKSWLSLNGHAAWRQSSEGRYRPGEIITDVLGHKKQTAGTWLPGQNNGQADVCCVVDGQFIAIEVKIGSDKQSEAQKRYQQQIEASGGLYYIARNFHDFLDWYDNNF